jgi:predicted tellurium resistance membrane protein TerC
MALLIAALVIVRLRWGDDLWIVLAGVTLGVLAVAWLARSTLSVSESFPEVARWPLIKRIVG